MRWLRDNGFALFFFAILFLSIAFQSVAGWHVYNHDAEAHGSETITWGRYLVSSHFGQAVLENWQSEYLQFSLLILAAIWLVQKGSTEAKETPGLENDQQQRLGRYAPPNAPKWARAGGWRRAIYSWSLLIVMGAIFFASWFGQSVTGWTEFNSQRQDHDEPTVSWGEYLTSAEFWEDTLQNWQSEFLAVGSVAIFTVFLRARGSAESKPVGAPHEQTGSSG
jgi:hypothetical protein